MPLSDSSSMSKDASTIPSADLVIVGGGMVGISLALLLAHANPQQDIVLVESFALRPQAECHYQSSFDARSTALSAGSRRIFEGIGLWSRLSQHLTAIRQVHVSDKGHFGGSVMRAEDYGLDALGYVVENGWLGSVLAGRLAEFPGIRVLAPARVSAARPMPEGYHLQLEDGQQLQCALLVLADGADSQLRHQLGIAVERQDYHQCAIVANINADRAHRGVAYERFTAAGPVALLPLGESEGASRMALIWTRPTGEAERLAEGGDADFLQQLQQSFGHRQGIFRQVGSRHLYPLSLSVAKEQVRRSLVIMGNAAHSLHPVAGQGFNLALRDCQALSRSLSAGVSAGRAVNDPALLDNYVEQQSTDQWLTIGLSDGFVRWFSSEDFGRAALRNLGLFALDLLPGAKRALAKQTMGLA